MLEVNALRLVEPLSIFRIRFLYKKTFSFFLEQEHCHVNCLTLERCVALKNVFAKNRIV